MNSIRALSLLLTFMPIAVGAAFPFSRTHRDTTIDGRTYAMAPAAHLVSQLQATPSGAVIEASNILLTGPFLARLAGLDTVHAHLRLEEILFAEEVNLDGVVFLGDVSCDRAQFQGGLSLLDATFHGDLILTGCHIGRHASCKRASFRGIVSFADSRFDGSASFIETAFHGDCVSFARARFEDAAYFERTRFAGPADFRDVTFQGQVSCKEASWEEGVSFAGARFSQRALFWQARFDGTVEFDSALTAGEIGFENATFAGPASFKHTVFVRPARFVETTFHDRVTFAGSRFQRDAEFYAARFASGAELRSLFAGHLDLRQVDTPFLDLRPPAGDPQSGAADSSFSADAQVFLQEANCGQLLVHWPHLAGRLAARDSSSPDDLAPVYATVRRQLEGRGLNPEADACRAEWLERRIRSLSWASPERYALQFFGFATRYGTDLGRLGLLALTGVLLFALLYRLLRAADGDRPLSLIDCTYLSFSTFLGRPPSHPAGAIRPLLLLQAILGWICWGLFIVTTLFLLTR